MLVKIVIAGPKATGKTLIANLLAGQGDRLTTERYEPTVGVRILEFELRVQGISEPINVELWDSSGDYQYESGWKAIMTGADGVILVYCPDAPSQDQLICDWYDYFVKKNGLKDEQCIVLAHRTSHTTERFRPPPLFSRVTAALTTPQSGPDIKNVFESFMKDICYIKLKK